MVRLRPLVEVALIAIGVVLLGASAGAVGMATWYVRADRIAFEGVLQAREAGWSAPGGVPRGAEEARGRDGRDTAEVPGEHFPTSVGPQPAEVRPRDAPPDTRQWSSARILGWIRSRPEGPEERLALLEIPSVRLQVVVLEGTSEWTLNRGVGRIEGTARPDEPGNLGIAGHRDGFFRALRNLSVGDAIRVRTAAADRSYRVEWIRVVQPQDGWVLAPTDDRVLTLVTCYPFWYVGSAPQRYIVRARAEASEPRAHSRKALRD